MTNTMISTSTPAPIRTSTQDEPQSISGPASGHSSTTSPLVSSQLSKSSSNGLASSASSTTTAAHSSASKTKIRPPTLEDIAARMKKNNLTDGRSDGSTATSDLQSDTHKSLPAMPQRLKSTTNESSDSTTGQTIPPPAPVAVGEPPVSLIRGRSEALASLRDKVAHRSRSASPVKPQAKIPMLATSSQNGIAPASKSSGSTLANKEMPSLQDIIERMSKKGIANGKNDSGNTSAKLSPPPAKVQAEAKSQPVESDNALTSPAKPDNQLQERSASLLNSAQSKLSPASSGSGSSVSKISPKEGKMEKDHPLQHKWTMYFDSKSWNPSTSTKVEEVASKPGSPPTGAAGASSWEAALKMLGVYTTVESFMSIFGTLRRPSQLERNSNYHLFKDSIKPMWEDPSNQNGGKWILTMRGTNPALLDRSWMWLVLALIGEELDDNDDVTGAVVSTRTKGDRIALWIRSKDDVDLVNKIGKKFVLLLDLEKEPGVSLEFSPNTMDDGLNRRNSAPSKFISFNNPPVYNSPVMGQSGGVSLAPHQPHRLNSSPSKVNTAGSTTTRIGMPPRRGSEQLGESGMQLFPMGLGGPIGRTASPGPSRTPHNPTLGGSIFPSKSKIGLGMSPPL